MALFKVFQGNEAGLPKTLTDGYCYFLKDKHYFYIDHKNSSNVLVRSKLSAEFADKLRYTKNGTEIEISPEEILNNIDKKLDKLTYEWNKSYNAGGTTGYLLIGSFPMYDTNITIDIDATTASTYHGTVIIATQNVSETNIGSAHTINVYDDPTGAISDAIRIVWQSGSRNYNIYFVPELWSKNFIHIRAIGNYLDDTDESKICTQFIAGTAPSTTNGLTINNILKTTLNNYLPLSGGNLTGNLSGKYLTGTWLQTTATQDLGSAASKIAVINPAGLIYYRTAEEIKSDIGAVSKAGDTMAGNLTAPTFIGSLQGTATNATNIYSSASTSKAYLLGTTTASSGNHATTYNASVYTQGSVLYGAAWNDYAEYRQTDNFIEPGRVVCENGDDTLSLSVERL